MQQLRYIYFCRRGGALLVLAALICGLQNSSQAQDETNLPPQVRDDIQRQLRAFNIPDNVKGMPWLDKSTNWNDFKNWPDEVHCLGTIYALKLQGQDYDASFDIKLRQEIRPGKDFSAQLIPRDFPTTNHDLAAVVCYWRKNQKVESAIKGVSGGYIRSVFILRFYPTGELHAYSRNVLGSSAYKLDYFDKRGEMVGYLTYPEAKTGTKMFVWKGVDVSSNELIKQANELYSTGKLPD